MDHRVTGVARPVAASLPGTDRGIPVRRCREVHRPGIVLRKIRTIIETAPQAAGYAMRLGETCISAGCPVLQWNRGFCRVRMAVFARNCSISSFRLHFCRFAGSVFRIIFRSIRAGIFAYPPSIPCVDCRKLFHMEHLFLYNSTESCGISCLF